jgi:hypothetical protein
MRLIKSLLAAILAAMMTATAGSGITHLFNKAEDTHILASIADALFVNTAYAQEHEDAKDDTLQDANQTFTTSLNTSTPSTVIDETNLPTPQNTPSQSPQQKDAGESVYVDILIDLVPVSGQDINYEKILGLTDDEIKILIEGKKMTIWDIAQRLGKARLLEDAYYSIYPARIIELLEQNTISQEMADLLIVQANKDVSRHRNTSIEIMMEKMLPTNEN